MVEMDGIETAWLWSSSLVALRWWALLQTQVLWRRAVGPWWWAISMGLAVVLAAGSSTAEPVAVAVDPWSAALAELGLGALVGVVVALPGHAALGAADQSARVLGAAPGPWRALTLAFVGATAISLGLHQPLLRGAHGLLEAWPVGDPLGWSLGAMPAPGRLIHALVLLALTMATPVLLAAAVAELGARAWGAGPAVTGPAAVAVAPWLRVAAALVATGASWAAYEAIWAARALGTDPGLGPLG
ncbi:hypothetical protein [Paraliomyxa miuraensis]|uniref:hypothetical protein n=1 Tax=Paraliomyxa miuraensis TaxID=376150 RepID=UPI00225A1BE9|nr:hypothetical protein [Paraliomyxa miuraensis]MCX4241307.1 hypothetical protein [Paraliomyxa miuraensis]